LKPENHISEPSRGLSGSALNQSRALLFVAGLSYLWLAGYIYIKGESGYFLPSIAACCMAGVSFLAIGLTYVSNSLKRNHTTVASLFFVAHSLFPVFFMWKMTDHNPAVLFIILFALVSIFQMSALRFIILHNVVLFLSLLFIHFTGQTSTLVIPAIWFFGSLIVSTAAAGVVQYFRIKNQKVEEEERLISSGILHTTSEAWVLIAMESGSIKYAGKKATQIFEIDKAIAGSPLFITDILGTFGESILRKAVQDPSSKPITVECRKLDGTTFHASMKCIRVSSQPDIIFCSFTEGSVSESTEGKTLQTAMRFRYYLNLTDEGIIICDQHGKTTLMNRPSLELLGLDAAENHTGKMLRELLPSSLWMKIHDYLIASLNFEKNSRSRILLLANSKFPCKD